MRHRLSGCITATIILSATAALGQSPYQAEKSVLSDVEFFTTNYGIFGRDVAANKVGYLIPRGSGISYIFGAGLWFGAMKKVGLDTNHLCFVTYEPSKGTSWAVPSGNASMNTTEPLYYSGDYDRLTGQAISGGADSVAWPLWLRDNQVAHPGDPGTYEPDWRKRRAGNIYGLPAFMPGVAEQFVARYNDGDLGRYTNLNPDTARSMGLPIGLDIEQNIYAWASGPFANAVIIEYAITNTSSDTLYNCVAAQFTDADLGTANNDHCSFHFTRPDLRAGFAFTEPEKEDYQVLVTAIIEGPVADQFGYVDATARKSYQHEGRAGCFSSWPVGGDPGTMTGYYNFVSEKWFADDDGPADRRMFMATTPFNMRPGDVAHFTVVYCTVDLKPVDLFNAKRAKVDTVLEAIMDAYYDRGYPAGISPETTEAWDGVTLTIDRASAIAVVHFSSNAVGSAMLHVVNMRGERVIDRDLGHVGQGAHETLLDLHGLPSGLYLVAISTGSNTSITKFTVVH